MDSVGGKGGWAGCCHDDLHAIRNRRGVKDGRAAQCGGRHLRWGKGPASRRYRVPIPFQCLCPSAPDRDKRRPNHEISDTLPSLVSSRHAQSQHILDIVYYTQKRTHALPLSFHVLLPRLPTRRVASRAGPAQPTTSLSHHPRSTIFGRGQHGDGRSSVEAPWYGRLAQHSHCPWLPHKTTSSRPALLTSALLALFTPPTDCARYADQDQRSPYYAQAPLCRLDEAPRQPQALVV